MTKKEIGENIRSGRKKLGITQEELGKRADVTGRYIQALEVGRRSPSKKLAAKLSDILQISIDKLIESPASMEKEFSKAASKLEEQVYKTSQEARLRQELIGKILTLHIDELEMIKDDIDMLVVYNNGNESDHRHVDCVFLKPPKVISESGANPPKGSEYDP